MIPKKLFTPKCLHPDRDVVFRDDLLKFYYTIISSIDLTPSNELTLISNFTYPSFKTFYKQGNISMFHFSKSKEENSKEFYEVLFGEIQLFLFNNTPFKFFNKLFSIYTLYSLYFTQTTKEFYEINTIPEYIKGLNDLINELYQSKFIKIAYDLYNMVEKLYNNNAFSIGVLLGLKSIILNNHGLPIDQKVNVYKDYYDIFNYKSGIFEEEEENNDENLEFNNLMNEYSGLKKEIVHDIKKNLEYDTKEKYVEYINDNLLEKGYVIGNEGSEEGGIFDKFSTLNLVSHYDNDQKIKVEDLNNDEEVNNFDCLFNKYLKKKEEEEKEKKKKFEQEENKLKRRKKMDQLVVKYEKRIHDFVFKMAERPIVVKKIKDKHMSNREELYAETSDKILSKKGFVFTQYKTDKERIKEYLEMKAALNRYFAMNSQHTNNALSTDKKINFIQPSMRFKPRTDLERVYDALRETDTRDRNGRIIRKQLHKMGFVSSYKQGDDDDDSVYSYGEKEKKEVKVDIYKILDDEQKKLTEEEKYKKMLHNKIIQDRKQMIKQRKKYLTLNFNKTLDNRGARFMHSDLHNKTHFKAMENITMFKTSTINNNLFKTFYKEDLEKQKKSQETRNNFYMTIQNSNMMSTAGFKRTKYNFNFPKIKNVCNNMNSLCDDDVNGLNNNIENKLCKTETNWNKTCTSSFKFRRQMDNDNNYNSDNQNINLNNNSTLNGFNLSPSNQNNNVVQNNINSSSNNNSNNPFSLVGNKKIFKDLEITKEIANSNPLLYNMNFNSTKTENGVFNITNEQMNTLKQMAFENHTKNENEDTDKEEDDTNTNKGDNKFYNGIDTNEEYKKDDNIVIDGEHFKKTDIVNIADRVLKKCNYNEKTKKFNNQIGKGKLMFTYGLTIGEFEKRYGLMP